MAEIRIKDINISIWNHQKVQFSAHPDVNIIMGIPCFFVSCTCHPTSYIAFNLFFKIT